MERDPQARAAVSGLIGTIVGLSATWIASLVWFPTWTLSQAMIAVGIASFFAAYYSAFFVTETLRHRT
jgi:hypothetical protein